MKKSIFLVLLVMIESCKTADLKVFGDLTIRNLENYSNLHHILSDNELVGFKNPYNPYPRDNLKAFFWVINKIVSGEDENKISPAEFIKIDKNNFLKTSSKYRFWWIGHSTVLIQGPKFNFITDPQFSQRASPVSFAGPIRHQPPAIEIQDLPRIDFVLISHNHYDHLDEFSVKEINKKFGPVFLVPLKVEQILKDWGIRKIISMDWWQYIEIENLKIYCTPARHFSARSLFDRNKTLWSGWFVKDTEHNFSFYFAGDTGYAPFFKEIKEYLGIPNVAMIPIGAFLPRWMMQEVHLDPVEAFQAFLDLDAENFLPIHWGTFYLAEEPMNLPPELLKKVYEDFKKNNPDTKKKVSILKIGEFIEE